MDSIELKKYIRTCGFVCEETAKPIDLFSKIKTAFRNATLTNERINKNPTEFYEFFINDKPLSGILTEFCKLENSLLDNWIGVLGSFPNKQPELIKIKRLLLEQITEKEIGDLFPLDLEKYYLDTGIDNYKEELADEEIIIYCCAECGDYDCGGFKIKVEKDKDTFVWTYNDEGRILQFHFDKKQYFNTFDTYRQTIINKL
ncbi:MAG TPA: hypothetical protein PLC59_09580 [Bacteroidales bacterium]|nr:hypothetical protein [Bacteroidales bacterium]